MSVQTDKFFAVTGSGATACTTLTGVYLREKAAVAAVATVEIRDSASDGTLVIPIELAANASVAISDLHLPATTYWHVVVTAGEVEGSLTGR